MRPVAGYLGNDNVARKACTSLGRIQSTLFRFQPPLVKQPCCLLLTRRRLRAVGESPGQAYHPPSHRFSSQLPTPSHPAFTLLATASRRVSLACGISSARGCAPAHNVNLSGRGVGWND